MALIDPAFREGTANVCRRGSMRTWTRRLAINVIAN